VTQYPISPFNSDLIDSEIEAILVSLARTGAWSSYNGPYLDALISSLSERCQRTYVQVCSSGTIAVELALRGCRIEAGDEVILAAYDFPGNFRAIEAIGATVAVADIGPESWSLVDIDELERLVGPKTKAVLLSHLHGTTASMAAISQWAIQRDLKVIEDACQVPGASIEGRPAGSWGDCSVLSFGGSKLLSAGRGGAILTNDARIDQRIRIYRERGNDAFPLSELQAAVLGPQLAKLDKRNRQRASVVAQIEQLVLPWKWMMCPKRLEATSNAAFYKWGFQVAGSPSHPNRLRDEVLSILQNHGVVAGPGFRGFGVRSQARCRRNNDLPYATRASQATVLVHHTMLGPQLSKRLLLVDQHLRAASLID